ncbi:XAC2610-related protein [Pedobacter agri]|uniref:XAC2610-related protein n=1 Tax=Pedobacter agri TaxID=454586 RepID=UPI00292F89BB|nr:hypothetical protein [Pedobacter agri]
MKFYKIFLVLSLILAINFSYAQKAKITSILNFTGTIKSYAVEMTLEISKDNDSVMGAYYYTKNGYDRKIYLKGVLKNNYLKLTENSYNFKKKSYEDSGYFNLSYQNSALNGSWQKTTDAPKQNILLVSLIQRENISIFNLADYDFILNRKAYQYKYTEEYVKDYSQLLNLQIQQKGISKWTIKSFDDTALMDDTNIILEDLNLDGLLDVKVPINYPGRTKGDFGFIYLIYDKASNSFKQNKQLNEMEFVGLDASKKEILKYDADGSGNEGTKHYIWHNGKLFLRLEVRIYENDAFTHFTEYRILNGKSIVARKYKRK